MRPLQRGLHCKLIFFFQAEDGIRDYKVTGVQTCALPILPPDFSVVRASGPEAPQVFARASGKPLTQGISSLFTYDGYHGLFLHELPKVTTLDRKSVV